MGQDPLDIEWLWQAMYRYPRWRGGPVLNSAISAIEMALWDIKGKALGVPVCQLLGGAARDRIRLYSDAAPPREGDLKAKADGYTAIKTALVPVKNNVVDPTRGARGRGGRRPCARWWATTSTS